MNIETTKVSITNESPRLLGIICYKQDIVNFCNENKFTEEEINNILAVYTQMYDAIKCLSKKRQLKIVFAACSIALKVGTESYKQIINGFK